MESIELYKDKTSQKNVIAHQNRAYYEPVVSPFNKAGIFIFFFRDDKSEV